MTEANYGVQKFDKDANFITKFGFGHVYDPGGEFCDTVVDGQPDFPSGLAVDFQREVYVTDTGHNRVQESEPCFIRAVALLESIGLAVDKSSAKNDIFLQKLNDGLQV